MSVNKVILVGRLGQDPELKYTPGGKAVCEFSLATGGGGDKPAEWHRIVTWEKQAELCAKYLAKGRQVYLEGKLHTSSWSDRDTGEKRYKTQVVANKITFLGSKPQDEIDMPDSE